MMEHAPADMPPLWRRALDAIDRRLVAMTALFAAGQGLSAELFVPETFLSGLAALARSELNGGLVLLLSACLLRVPRMPRLLGLAIGVVAGCLIARALTSASLVGARFVNFPGGDPSYGTIVWFFARRQIVYWGILAAAWYFIDRAAHRRARLHESDVARRQLQTRLVEARLAVLQAQVEPHFLFNTLAHLKRLFKTDPALAQKMLDGLCDYLRAAFPQMRNAKSTLRSELALAAAYLEVQHLRLGERLEFEFEVAEHDARRAFPPMMLMSLVENAIKHGITPLPQGGRICVSAVCTADTLRVVVADTGNGMSTARGSGIGLANIANRLAALYGSAGRLTLAANRPRGLRATIDIPLGAT